MAGLLNIAKDSSLFKAGHLSSICKAMLEVNEQT